MKCNHLSEIAVNIASDLNMPLGKIIAQASHGVGLSYLSRIKVQYENYDCIGLEITEDALNAILSNSVKVTTTYCKMESLNNNSDECSVDIIDSGRTVFNEPTKTCVASAKNLGATVLPSLRLQYDDNNIPVKQAIFVNKKAIVNISEEEMISLFSEKSAEFITDIISDDKFKLDKKSSLFSWLTSAFGKTVVGTKNKNKFNLLIKKLEDDNINFKPVIFNNELIGVCTTPIDSEIIHIYTKYKTFNLLS